MKCPKCREPMRVSWEDDERILWKCHIVGCGRMVMVVKGTERILQEWRRNDV